MDGVYFALICISVLITFRNKRQLSPSSHDEVSWVTWQLLCDGTSYYDESNQSVWSQARKLSMWCSPGQLAATWCSLQPHCTVKLWKYIFRSYRNYLRFAVLNLEKINMTRRFPVYRICPRYRHSRKFCSWIWNTKYGFSRNRKISSSSNWFCRVLQVKLSHFIIFSLCLLLHTYYSFSARENVYII